MNRPDDSDRIDLPREGSRHLDETERNLGRISADMTGRPAAVRRTGVVVERRPPIREANDRYPNFETTGTPDDAADDSA